MNLAKWVFAMDKFFNVNKIVVPKKQQLKVSEEKYAAVMKVLSVKQAELKVIVDRVNSLKADLKMTQDKKADLEAQVADCEARLIKATSLIGGLGGEKTRWKAESERLQIVYEKNSVRSPHIFLKAEYFYFCHFFLSFLVTVELKKNKSKSNKCKSTWLSRKYVVTELSFF